MLIDFSVQNYKSFKDRTTLSLEPIGASAPHALNFAAIYGPNASGKSNVFKALDFMRFAMLNESAVQAQTVRNPNLQPFLLDTQSATEPIQFELTLYDKERDSTYRYGFEIQKEAVKSEWLLETALRSKRVTERQVFVRDYQEFTFATSVNKPAREAAQATPATALALPRIANTDVPQALQLVVIMRDKLVLFNATQPQAIFPVAAQRLQQDAQLYERVLAIVRELDMSIQGFRIDNHQMTPDERALLPLPEPLKTLIPANAINTDFNTLHNVYNDKGDVVSQQQFNYNQHESQGTQNLIPFVTMLVEAMDQDFILVIDEFGSGLHPFITEAIVKIFKKQNHNAQMIVFTHETYLLKDEKLIGRDSLWFVEKDRHEISSLVALAEYKARGDARLQKQYLEGRFGAVPIIVE